MVNHKKALELLWKGTCNVIIKVGKTNPTNKRTEFEEETIYTNQPCKLSFESITSTNETDNVASISQGVKLFLSPTVSIPAGSKIVVTQNGKTADYEKSGEPAIYTNHQEVPLELFKGWA